MGGRTFFLGLLLGAFAASAVWYSQWHGKIDDAAGEAAAQVRAKSDDGAVWLLERATCEKFFIPGPSVASAWESGLYWPPGATVKDCARGTSN